jgi:hypothetical protein
MQSALTHATRVEVCEHVSRRQSMRAKRGRTLGPGSRQARDINQDVDFGRSRAHNMGSYHPRCEEMGRIKHAKSVGSSGAVKTYIGHVSGEEMTRRLAR